MTLLSDAHTAENLVLGDGTKVAAPDMVRELNIAMQWMSYSGRKNAVATAEQVNFDGAVAVVDELAAPARG